MGFAAALEGPHFVGPDATFRRAVVGSTQVDGGSVGFLAGLEPKKHLSGMFWWWHKLHDLGLAWNVFM